MSELALLFARLIETLKLVFFASAVVLFVVFSMDWLVRTRRINSFGPVARFFRGTVQPLITPIERRVVTAGGLPSSAPWWALVAVVVGGILIIFALEFVLAQVQLLAFASRGGARGFAVLLIRWTFGILQIALVVRVISSWFRISPYSRWVRWAVVLTEPILRPLRGIIPTLGMIDITPLVAWFLLMILQRLLLGML